MKKITLLFIAGFIVASCATVKTIPMKFRVSDEPSLNTSQTKELGERLVLKGEEYYQDALQITEMSETDFSISMMKYPYGIGDSFPLKGSNKDWELFYRNDMVGTTTMYMIGVARNKSNPAIVRPFLWTTNGIATKRMDVFKVKETTYTDPKCENCFKQEFIFNGRVGNNLKFIYREYINDFARPAFTQELQYDLNESSTIGFKGMRLEIEKATNTNITYKVLSSFSK